MAITQRQIQCLERKKNSIEAARLPQSNQNTGYMCSQLFSGIRMFIPYTPARKVSGMKIVLIMVSTFMISFIWLDMDDI